METVHIDLSGPYEASLGGSVCMIMFLDSASRWMWPYGMRRKSETTAYVQMFLADMNGMGRPNCFPTDNGGGFSGLSGRRFADNDAGVHHNINVAVTAINITAGNVTAVTITAVTVSAVTAATVPVSAVTAATAPVIDVTAATVTAGNVTAENVIAVTAAAATSVTTATVAAFTLTAGSFTVVSVFVLGDAAGVWPYPLEDDPVFRHADDALVGNAGGVVSLVASEKRRDVRSQRWPSVHDGQEGVSVDDKYVWSD